MGICREGIIVLPTAESTAALLTSLSKHSPEDHTSVVCLPSNAEVGTEKDQRAGWPLSGTHWCRLSPGHCGCWVLPAPPVRLVTTLPQGDRGWEGALQLPMGRERSGVRAFPLES